MWTGYVPSDRWNKVTNTIFTVYNAISVDYHGVFHATISVWICQTTAETGYKLGSYIVFTHESLLSFAGPFKFRREFFTFYTKGLNIIR